MQYLGDTAEAIAREKAGIIKAGVPCIYDAANEEAARVIRAAAERKAHPLFRCAGIIKFQETERGRLIFRLPFAIMVIRLLGYQVRRLIRRKMQP